MPAPLKNDVMHILDADDRFALEKIKIKILDRCNAACLKCGRRDPGRRRTFLERETMTPGDWERLAGDLAALGARKAAITGGEPTVYEHLADFVAALSRGGLRASLTTNGLDLTPALAGRLIGAGLTQIRFSVDGATPELHDPAVGRAGAFERLSRGMEAMSDAARAADRKLSLEINTVITHINLTALDSVLEWAAGRGVETMLLMPLNPFHLTPEVRARIELRPDERERFRTEVGPRLLERGTALGVRVAPLNFEPGPDGALVDMTRARAQDPRVPCHYAWTQAAVLPDGGVYVCCNSKDPRLKLGDLHEASLPEILSGERARQVRAICRRPGDAVPDCRACELYGDRLAVARALGIV